jgi:DNA-binding HxlR family transcriptional regulator
MSDCPICFSLDVFGDRWTLLILRDLLVRKKRFYQDFLNSGEGIATNILSARLKKLLADGLIVKKDNPENKNQPIYAPTKKAVALLPILGEMVRWGHKFGPPINDPFLRRLIDDPERARKELRKALEDDLETPSVEI